MTPRGFTVFFAVLVASLALAIGLAVYDLLLRELELSQTARESQYAIYAADTGVECALYWDFHYDNGTEVGSAFATSTESNPPTSNIRCNDQDVAATAVAASTWPQTESATAATTTFEVYLVAGDTTSPCALVEVAKYAENPGDPPITKVVSRGRNTSCSAVTSGLQIERALEVNY